MRTVVSLIGALALAGVAGAQERPRWTLTETGGVTIAHTTLQSRAAVIARCARGQLSVLLQGVPAPADNMSVTTIVDASVDLTNAWWLAGTDGMLMSRRPAAFIRGLAEGQSVAMSAPRPGASPWVLESFLPEDRAPIDAVLTACDTPLSDPRDALEQVWKASRGSEKPPVRWARQPTPNWPGGTAPQHIRQGSVVLTCITGEEGRLSDCRAESESPLGVGFGREAVKAANVARLNSDMPAGVVVEFEIRFFLP